MALSNVIVQCLTDADKALAKSVLTKHGDLSESAGAVYVRGRCDEADAKLLEEKGLVVELLPARPAMSWLEPASKTGAAPKKSGIPHSSPLHALSAAGPEYFLVQLAGPLRSV